MKIRLMSFCCFLFLTQFSLIAFAEPVKTAIPLAQDETQIYVAMEIWQEKLNPPLAFVVTSPSGLSGPDELLLAQYYALAKANNMEGAKNIYALSDGSKDALLRQLAMNNDYFGNYFQLEQVEINSRKYWGGYHFLDVKLSGNGQTTEWRENILCENGSCKLSAIFDNSSEKEHLLETAFLWTDAFLSEPFDQVDLNAKMATLRSQNRSTSIYPDYLPNGLPIYPITIHVHLTQLPEALFVINPQSNDGTVPTPPIEVQTILDMLKDTSAHTDRGTIENALIPHWTSMPGGGLFRMTERKASKEDDQSPINLKSTPYTWEAFYDRVKQWTTIRILGIARSGGLTYIFVEPGFKEGGMDTIQLFTVAYQADSENYRLVTDTDQVVPWYIMKSSMVMQFISQQYQ